MSLWHLLMTRDNIVVEAARELEEDNVQMEKLAVVRNHELEWFKEDHIIDFSGRFTKFFVSSSQILTTKFRSRQ